MTDLTVILSRPFDPEDFPEIKVKKEKPYDIPEEEEIYHAQLKVDKTNVRLTKIKNYYQPVFDYCQSLKKIWSDNFVKESELKMKKERRLHLDRYHKRPSINFPEEEEAIQHAEFIREQSFEKYAEIKNFIQPVINYCDLLAEKLEILRYIEKKLKSEYIM
jgi:hypothetical protein